MTGVQTCASGNAEVLRGDSLAWEALRVYRQEHSRLCRLRHPELKAYSHNWYEVHREKYLAWSRSSYYSHPEKYIAWSRGWARSHPEQSSEIATKYRRHRRALLAGASGSFTSTEFGALCEESGDRCTYCGRSKEEVGELVPDHMTPLTRGGSDSIDNITPACTEDNGSKGNKTVPEYLEYLEHLVNRAEVRFSGEHNSKV